MGFLCPTQRCPHCGEQVKLRSFRPPPNKCPHCGQLRDPHATREIVGGLALLPIAIAAAIAFGYAGFFLGQLLAPVVNIPDLAPRLAFLAGADGVGLASVLCWRAIGGPNAKNALAPATVFVMFVAFGMKCGVGLGVRWLIVWGLANGVLGFLVALPLLPRPRRPS